MKLSRQYFLAILFLLLGISVVWAEEGETTSLQVAPATRVEQVGVGACLGQGAGLAGVYVKFNPIDHLGFEADLGKRMFLLMYGDDVEVYWPTAAAFKARYYFFERTHRINAGIEGGLLYTEDQGSGGEASGLFTFRINRHLHLDASLGIGVMPNSKESEIDYLTSQTGHSHAYYENNTTFSWESPVMFFWGLGIAFMF
jgi:hypothetical protein